MCTRPLLALLLGATTALVLVAPACTQERESVPTPGGGGLGSAVSQPATTATSGGNGGGEDAAGGQGGGDGGSGGGGEDGGGGGDGRTLPQCACLLDQVRTPTCGTCVSFGVVDQCDQRYSACQGNALCKAVDDCVLVQACADGDCLETCRALGDADALRLFESMYECACDFCKDDCDSGSSCR